MRETCIICKINYNCEELAQCIKCKGHVCQDCLLFEEGNYYCLDCQNSKE